MTRLSEAFEAAGYVAQPTDRERLEAMMREAIRAGSGIAEPSIEHFIAKLLSENDFGLAWELGRDYREGAMARLFRELLPQVRAEKRPGSRDHFLYDAQRPLVSQTGAPPMGAPEAPPPSGEGERRPSGKLQGDNLPTHPVQSHTWMSQRLPNSERLLNRRDYLTIVQCNGKPICACSLRELAQAAQRLGREARFIQLLLDNLDYVSDRDRLLGEFYDIEQAEVLWRQAEAVH